MVRLACEASFDQIVSMFVQREKFLQISKLEDTDRKIIMGQKVYNLFCLENTDRYKKILEKGLRERNFDFYWKK